MKYKNKNYKKIAVISLTVVAVVGLGLWLWQTRNQNKVSETETQAPQETINYNPPTENEKQEGDLKKQETEQKGPSSPDTSVDGKKQATVLITDATQYGDTIEVRAFIPNYFQDGTCIIQFTKDSQTIKRETPAYTDSSTTICTNPVIKSSEFPTKGVWQVKVSYSSADAAGVSASQPVEVK